MFWEYIFGKNMTYTYKFKEYYHLKETEDTITTKKGYVCDSIETFLLRNPINYEIESKSFNWSNGTVDVTCYKEIYKLPTPVVEMNAQTYSQYSLKITNTGIADVTLYSQNFPEGTTYDIKAGKSIVLEYSWSSSSASVPETVNYKMYFSAYRCTDSDVVEFKAIKETEEKKEFSYAPVITTNGNTYSYCEIMVTNKNNVDVTYYDRDVNDSGYIDIGAGESIYYTHDWSNDMYTSESHTFSGYFSASGYTSSDTSLLTVDKPVYVKTKIAKKPVITLSSNSYTSYTVIVTNNNLYTVAFYSQDLDGALNISSGSSKSFTISWGTSATSHTVSGYFSAYNYYDSDYGTLSVTRPDKPTLTAPSIEEHTNTYTQLGLRYKNNASVKVTMTIDGTSYTISSGGYKDIIYSWYSATTMTKSCTVSADNYNSNSASETFTRPSLPKLTAPTLDIMSNTYEAVIFTVYNPNSVSADVYDTGGNCIISQLSPYSDQQYGKYYTGTAYTLSCYFMGDSTTCLDSSLSSLTATRPSKPTLSAPQITYTQGTGTYKTKYLVNVYNPNSVACTLNYSGTDITSDSHSISAKGNYGWYVDVLTTYTSRTYKATLSASGYDDVSSSLTIKS